MRVWVAGAPRRLAVGPVGRFVLSPLFRDFLQPKLASMKESEFNTLRMPWTKFFGLCLANKPCVCVWSAVDDGTSFPICWEAHASGGVARGRGGFQALGSRRGRSGVWVETSSLGEVIGFYFYFIFFV